jgi:hypothetical protein
MNQQEFINFTFEDENSRDSGFADDEYLARLCENESNYNFSNDLVASESKRIKKDDEKYDDSLIKSALEDGNYFLSINF